MIDENWIEKNNMWERDKKIVMVKIRQKKGVHTTLVFTSLSKSQIFLFFYSHLDSWEMWLDQ